MTAQMPHRLENTLPDVDLRGLDLYGVICGPVEDNHGWGSGRYRCRIEPDPDDSIVCSANWRGHLGEYCITPDGRLILKNYIYPSSEKAPTAVDETFRGEFFLVMKHGFESPRIYIPFTDGRIVKDRSRWLCEDAHHLDSYQASVEFLDAVEQGRLSKARELLGGEHSIMPLDDYLTLACREGHPEIVDLLISRGLERHWGYLPVALLHGNYDVAGRLLQLAGVDVEEVLPSGESPLVYAIEKELSEIALLLLLRKARTSTLTEDHHGRLLQMFKEDIGRLADTTASREAIHGVLLDLAKDACRSALSAKDPDIKRRSYSRAADFFDLSRKFGALTGASKTYFENVQKKLQDTSR